MAASLEKEICSSSLAFLGRVEFSLEGSEVVVPGPFGAKAFHSHKSDGGREETKEGAVGTGPSWKRKEIR